ncbi:globin-coupled sensor protein [Asticcacaulis sp. BYS171W]|uniref:Globin-coupled sensor protein n=1 Tax=Asticcacaulis aquaticus TaxID=2984212 RepID=A0ABT5HQS8_9CAUL|nr:globin-coupled sensor protein [Asticcacaulis aquaticus]MDC7682411.1 globin-coupled sensor protein [Asticcacaulis aquaticus]
MMTSAASVVDTNYAHRLAFARIAPADIMRLKTVWPVLEPHLPRILNAFYAHVKREDSLARMIGDHEDRLQRAQISHWRNLFTSGFSEAYFEQAYRIGQTHHRIGLEPRWYVAAYQFVLDEIIAVLAVHNRFRTQAMGASLTSVIKAVFLDLDIAISTYQHASEEAIRVRSRATESAIEDFRTAFDQIAGIFAESSAQLQGTSQDLGQTVGITEDTSRTVADVAARSQMDASSVAAASEELTKSIQEITSQVTGASQHVRRIVTMAETSSEEVAQLSGAVNRIGEILGLIQGIASQTNLLALNATIEAARAGDAGKGFAVVATEVKALADQTARATTEIGNHIQTIQASTGRAVASIRDIAIAVNDVEAATTSVAAAMEEQSTATNEIAGSIQHVSDAAGRLSDHISALDGAVQKTRAATRDVDGSAGTLTAQSQQLTTHVERFFETLRKAS